MSSLHLFCAALLALFSEALAATCSNSYYYFYCSNGCCYYKCSYCYSYYTSCCTTSGGDSLYIGLGVTAAVIIIFAAVFCGWAYYAKSQNAKTTKVGPNRAPTPVITSTVVHPHNSGQGNFAPPPPCGPPPPSYGQMYPPPPPVADPAYPPAAYNYGQAAPY